MPAQFWLTILHSHWHLSTNSHHKRRGLYARLIGQCSYLRLFVTTYSAACDSVRRLPEPQVCKNFPSWPIGSVKLGLRSEHRWALGWCKVNCHVHVLCATPHFGISGLDRRS